MSSILLVAAALTLPGSIIEIGGDGKSSEIRKDIPEAVTLEPGGIYGFSYSAKSDAPAHCLAGTWFAALGSGEPGDGVWRRRRSMFTAPHRGKPFQTRFHFGQWRPNGKVEIKDAELVRLKAEYLKGDMLELGGGERLDGNEYLYSFPFGFSGRSHSRPLLSFDCPFNGRLWWFNPNSRVTYRHSLEGRSFLRGEVFVGTSDWSDANGSVAVEISADGKSWRKVGDVASRTSVDAELPKDIFPCKTVFVRLTGGTNGTIQIAHYNFKGTVDGKPVRMFGETRYVEEDSGRVFAEIGKSFYDDDNFGSLLASDDYVDLWTAGSGRKIVRTRRAPKTKGSGLVLRTAANEAESVQLAVRARTGISDVKVALRDDLVCEKSGFCLPSACVDVKRVGYVDVRHPTDFEGLPISVPDKLHPVSPKPVRVDVGENQPFWVTVRPPKGTNKGIYTGVLDVVATHKGGKKSRYSVPLAVEVFGFDLPDTMTCQTAFGLTSSLIAKAHGLMDKSPEYRDVIERYLRAMSENHLSPYFPAMLAHYKVKWEGDVPVFDFEDWERELERVFSTYHFNTFMVWIPGLGECSMTSRRDPEFMGMKPADPCYGKRLGSYVAEIEKFLKRKGWLDKAYAYVYDEPRSCDYDLVRFGYGFLEKHAPGLRRMLPALAHHAFKELSGPVNLWCPQIQYLASPELRNVRERGDKIWWYICNNPKAPYACDFIDHSAPELRIWLWQTWKERVDGVLIWDVFNWRGQTKHPDQNGEGRFLYPPEECAGSAGPVVADPVQSVRIAHLRDGLEDYEYFAVLKRLSPENPLLKVPEAVTASLTDFSRDLRELEKHRIRLAREIERLCGGQKLFSSVYGIK